MKTKSISAAIATVTVMCCLALSPAYATSVNVASGTPLKLELQHHITPTHTPVGSTIYFRVAEDVTIDNAVAIRKGTLVQGAMRSASERGMVGTSGSLSFDVRHVTAADGQAVRVVASVDRQGRDRGDAVFGWTVFWGLPGLVTRGMNPYIERGAVFEAQVLTDTRVSISTTASDDSASSSDNTASLEMTGHALEKQRISTETIRLNLERDSKRRPIHFAWRAAAGSDIPELSSLELAYVDGIAVPEPIASSRIARGRATFDSWQVLKFCRHGPTVLGFRGVNTAGEAVAANYTLNVTTRRRE